MAPNYRATASMPRRALRGPQRRITTSPHHHITRSPHRGFTLIEAALTTVIIGTGVLAILAAQQAYHQKNDWAGRTSTAVLLANELRELTLPMPPHDPIVGKSHVGPESDETDYRYYDDVDDFAGPAGAGLVFGAGQNPPYDKPINALRQAIPGLDNWSQEIKVENVLPDNISATFTQPLGTTELMRVTVTVKYRKPGTTAAETITTLTWVVADK